MKRTNIVLIAVLGTMPILAGAGCPAEFDTPDVNAIFDVFINPDDPRLLKFRSQTAELITAFGERDAEGVPTRITSLFVQQPWQEQFGAGTWTHFDDQDRLTRIVAADGAVLTLEWQSDSTFLLNGISGDSTGQVNTIVDLNEGAPRARTADAGVKSAAAPAKPFPIESIMQSTTDETRSTLVIVNVKRCGATPDDREVDSVTVTLEGSNPPVTIPAVRMDSGRYAAKVVWKPQFTVDEALKERICESLGNIVLRACNDPAYRQRLQNQLCSKLAAALEAAGIADGPKGSLQAACNNGFASIDSYCDEIRGAAQLGVQGSLICMLKKEDLDGALSESVPAIVSATAVVRGSGARKSTGTIDLRNSNLPGGGPPQQLTIDYGQEAQVISAETIPADPAPGQGYVFRVKVACAAGKQYIIAVSGSDGYLKFVDFWPDYQGDTFEVSIPGGSENVQDTIKFADRIADKTLRIIAIVF